MMGRGPHDMRDRPVRFKTGCLVVAVIPVIVLIATLAKADPYVRLGALYSSDDAHLEGSADDYLEENYGWVTKTGKGDFMTSGDSYATGGRVALGFDTDIGSVEFGWANLGKWDMTVEELATGERRVTAKYAILAIDFWQNDQWTLSALTGLHNTKTVVHARSREHKTKVSDESSDWILGARASYGQWSLSVERWKGIGVEHTTGRFSPTVATLSYRLNIE